MSNKQNQTVYTYRLVVRVVRCIGFLRFVGTITLRKSYRVLIYVNALEVNELNTKKIWQ